MTVSWHMVRLLRFFAVSLVASTMPAMASTVTALKPNAAALRVAATHGLPVEGIEFGDDMVPRPGDRVIVLFSITEPGRAERQWLAEFRTVPLTDSETRAKPGSGLGLMGLFFSSLHTDTGHEHKLPGSPAAIAVRTLGPFVEGDATSKPTDRSERVVATREYLAAGLADMSEVEQRLRDSGRTNPGLSYMFRPKYSEEQMTAAKRRAAQAGFTIEDERAYAAGALALVQFAFLALRTAGVEAITREIVEPPGLFTSTFINPEWNNFSSADGAEWGLPGVRVYQLPYRLWSKTNARGTFHATRPRPPLQNMAGLLGVTVEETSKQPGRQLIIRILAARPGAVLQAMP